MSTYILQQLYTIADSVIVGKGLGDNALAAVGNMASLTFLIIGSCTGLALGFGIPVSQSFGAKDYERMRRSIASGIKLSAVIAVIATALTMRYLETILIKMQVAPEIIADSIAYGSIMFGGLSVTLAYNYSSCVLRALGDSKTPFIAIMVSTATNIAADIFLIFVMKTGVVGAAAATILSQGLSAFICIRRLTKIELVRLKTDDFAPNFGIAGNMLRIAVPMSVMNSVTAVGSMVVQYYINGMGVVCTAAYAGCSRYLIFFMQPSVAIGNALSSFTSQNYGAGRIDRIREGCRVSAMYALLSYVVFAVVLVGFPRQLAMLMLSGEEQIALSVGFLPFCGIMMWTVDLIFVYRFACQGMGHTFIPLISGAAEMLMRVGVIVLFLAPWALKRQLTPRSPRGQAHFS